MPALMPSELPEQARTQHHWIVLLRLPPLWPGVAGVVVFLLAVIWPLPWLVLFVLLVGAVAFLRWQTWQAELIILTRKRIIRVQGVPETTTSEAFLRIDRISGARLVQTVPGKILGYGTIEIEAPGEHPDVRRLKKIPDPQEFYGALRRIVFGAPGSAGRPDPHQPAGPYGDPPDDPDDAPAQAGYVTAPLPRIVDDPRH